VPVFLMQKHEAPDPGRHHTPVPADAPPVDRDRPGHDPFARLFDLTPLPAVVSRLHDGIALAVNMRTAELIGVEQHQAIGRPVTDYYVDPAQRLQLAEQLRRDGRADHVRLQIKRESGEVFWALASSRLLSWHGEPAVLTVFHDISEQLAAETSLRESERRLVAQSDALTGLTARYVDPSGGFGDRLRAILPIAADALHVERLSMWRIAEDGLTIECAGLYQQTGGRHESGAVLRREEAPAYFEAITRERVIAAGDAATDPRTRAFRDSYLVPNGIGAMLDVPLRQSNTTVGVLCAEHVGGPRTWTIDEQNFAISVANLIVVAIVEEDRRIVLSRLAESEGRARLIVDTAHDAFIGIDSAGTIVAWNAQAERTFGWSRDEVAGRNLAATIIPPAFRDSHASGMRRFHQTGEARIVNQRLELTALHRRGHEFPVELTVTEPMGVDSGFFFGAFLRDISDRRERDAELRRAKDSAEAATRAKSEFLANMSHELRTPLNGVLGYAQLLQRDRTLNAIQREALDAIAKCGSQLLELINDVLDLSKIEAGRVDIEEVPTDLARLLTDLRYVVAETAHQKGLTLTMTIAGDVPRRVRLDGRHLRQVLLNLLGNAIKFTAAGEVRLLIASDGDDRLVCEVVDTGIGIEPQHLGEIFDAFAQTKAGAAAGGSGLGLAISDHLIRKMQGTLQVDSVPGKGSRFFFSLPLVAVGDGDEPGGGMELTGPPLDARLAPDQELTALVVDDSTANRRILASLLESAGVRVITAAGGLEAIRLARTHRPEVIFMDLKMSDLDGLEATRRLGRDPATATIPVIAVTASALGDVRQASRDAGCVGYLSKPVRAESLFGMLQTHLNVRFVWGEEPSADVDARLADAERHAGIAARLRDALALGDVGDIQRLAQDLMAGSDADAACGQRISRLVTNFDFDGLGELAEWLAVVGGGPRADRS
jgi:PAS domain S-box-containing protein